MVGFRGWAVPYVYESPHKEEVQACALSVRRYVMENNRQMKRKVTENSEKPSKGDTFR